MVFLLIIGGLLFTISMVFVVKAWVAINKGPDMSIEDIEERSRCYQRWIPIGERAAWGAFIGVILLAIGFLSPTFIS